MSARLLVSPAGTASHTSWLIFAGGLLAALLAFAVLLAARRLGRLPRPVPEMADLSRHRQRLVLRAVQRGQAVSDPALAAAAVAHAHRARQRLDLVQSRGWRVLAWSVAGLVIVLSVVDLASNDRDLGSAALNLVLAAFLAANPYLLRRQFRLAQRSEQLNRQLIR